MRMLLKLLVVCDGYFAFNSVVTVIETGTETAVFFCKTEPKPRFYASVLTVRFWNGAAVVSWTLSVSLLLYCCRCRPLRIRKPNRNRNCGF